MQDYRFVSFFLGHDRGDEARSLLADCGLLEIALSDRLNRNAWLGESHFGVYLRLPVEDARLNDLLKRLDELRVQPHTRIDREHSTLELDQADWLVLRTATAGLYGGVDYGQVYDFARACETCGACAVPVAPLVAELGAMGKKDIDHLVYEGHLVVSARVAEALRQMSGVEILPVKSPRRAPDDRFAWLKVTGELPPMHPSTTGYVASRLCPECGRGGHYADADSPEAPVYSSMPSSALDFNQTFEYFGNWRQVRSKSHTRPVGGGAGLVVSQRVRQALVELGVRRLVWVPVSTLS